jgi:acetoin utilization deacetylase AcuC-like enzyme
MNTPTGYVYDPLFLKHTKPGHPENVYRLKAILDELTSSGLLATLRQIPARIAALEEVTLIHTPAYLELVQSISRAGGGALDSDTYTTRDSYEAALMAAGSLIDLMLAVIDGQVNNGFALVRPPGHHALPDQAMGFCLFNNVAIAAESARQQRDLARIAIVDIDVHHGNGTQAVFETDPGVLYISTHQFPHYPNTGRLHETGRDRGVGATVNCPLPTGVGDTGFRTLYLEVILPVLRRFKPQLLLVSAGYDCHWKDPLANMGLSLTGIAWISETLVQAAQELCAGRIVFTLEGGYHRDVLKHGVTNSIRALLGRNDYVDPFGKSPEPEPDLTGYLAEVKNIHKIE